MAQFLKRGSLGRMVPAEGGESDPDLCEVRLTAEEYEDFCLRIESAEADRDLVWEQLETAEDESVRAREAADQILENLERIKKEAKQKNDHVIASANRQLEEYKTKIDQEARRRIATAEEAAQEATLRANQAEQALERQINLNHNLKRIARERANADRGITPKKEHDGYLVLSSRQWKEKYMYDLTEEEYKEMPDDFRRKHSYPCSDQRIADAWKSIIQTPYDASIPINQIGPIIEHDDLLHGGILMDLNCQQMSSREFNGEYADFGTNDEGYDINGLYRWAYVANYKSGFWEIEIYTTKSLRVPPHRRPEPVGRKKQKKQKKEKNYEVSEVTYEFDDDEYL